MIPRSASADWEVELAPVHVAGDTEVETPQTPGSHALALLIGDSETSTGDFQTFRWEDGNVLDLGTLGGSKSGAWVINDDGDIVGWAETASGDVHAVIWRRTTP